MRILALVMVSLPEVILEEEILHLGLGLEIFTLLQTPKYFKHIKYYHPLTSLQHNHNTNFDLLLLLL